VGDLPSGDGAAPGDDTAPGDDAPPPPRTLGTGWHTLEHEGSTRDFLLHVTEDVAEGAPLVFVLHGYSDDAASIQRYSEMDAAADREGFIVVYPQGTTDSFGYSYWEVGYAFHDGTVDDVGFLRALRARIVADHGLDPGAVFAAGMSNGGDMMYRLACEAPGDFAAVAPVAGCLMGWLAESCAPTPAVPLLEIHGTADRTTPWEGDLDGSDGYGPYYGTEASVGHFVSAYGLDLYAEEALPDLDPTDASTVVAQRWSSDARAAEVWLYTIEQGRHDWPGPEGNGSVRATDEIVTFFRRFRTW
jgi:polyhydroxybutyrate depolymerase